MLKNTELRSDILNLAADEDAGDEGVLEEGESAPLPQKDDGQGDDGFGLDDGLIEVPGEEEF